MILIIYAHPYPHHSHANKRMIQAAGELDGVEVRSLYDLYPDFTINVRAEQQALSRASLVVWQHPMQWYSMPPLLKLWFDKVLEHGWAYGQGGDALHGKQALWAVTTGGDQPHFKLGDFPHFDALAQPLQATALYCGMAWQPPFVLHGTFSCDAATLEAAAARYRAQLAGYLAATLEAAANGGEHG
ncbi:glutathione-regulated potassium-efflux system oxidoreductase KefF [Nissabacter sp. SGAir0207]|uniref:glutathione-regulated potassium-efflux system oxidoreductase KefF n=1 Tax=Nissabacter sp. SGAir0207 TaxID=2126321 RepID=UPI0010CD5B4B|nr:glutathione-regulated potassium-efflux system oxidoreductase KefF [Nissabacter sp. SGAir0207]QCR37192.1 glutathione-regulated potassium-efflux system oxidoreductase KefF [Nissabacter sp. SGAir0207]